MHFEYDMLWLKLGQKDKQKYTSILCSQSFARNSDTSIKEGAKTTMFRPDMVQTTIPFAKSIWMQHILQTHNPLHELNLITLNFELSLYGFIWREVACMSWPRTRICYPNSILSHDQKWCSPGLRTAAEGNLFSQFLGSLGTAVLTCTWETTPVHFWFEETLVWLIFTLCAEPEEGSGASLSGSYWVFSGGTEWNMLPGKRLTWMLK